MSFRPLAFLLLVVVLVLPGAAAQGAAVRVRAVPQYDEVALGPGQKGGVDLSVNLEVRTSCTSGTEFGVTLVFVDPFPQWAGASPEPANMQFGAQGGRQGSKLEMFPAEDAPAGQGVTYKLRPEVKLPPATNCTGSLTVDWQDALVKLTILSPDQTGGPVTTGGDASPGFGVASLLLLGAGWALLRRRP